MLILILSFYFSALDSIYSDLLAKKEHSNIVGSQEWCMARLEYTYFLMFHQIYGDGLERAIEEVCVNCCYDENDCGYLSLRYEREIRFANSLPSIERTSEWEILIASTQSESESKLLSDILSNYAIHLDYDLNYKDYAIKIYLRAIESAHKVDSEYEDFTSYSSYANIGAIKQEKGLWGEAIEYYKLSYNVYHNRERPLNQIKLLEWISQAYAIGGNADSSLHYLNLAYDLTNDYQEHEKAKGIQEIQNKYDKEKLQRNITEQQLLLSQRQLYAVGFGSLSLLLAGGWLFYRRRAQHTMSKERQQAQLDSINARLNGEEQERIRVAQVLHDGIASQLTAADFQLSALRAASSGNYDASIDRSVDLIRDTSSQVRELSHELVPPVLLKLGLIPALEDLCHKYSSERLSFTMASAQSDVELSMDRDKSFTLYLITQELLQNIMKHSDSTIVTIQHYILDEQLSIEITDNSSISLADDLSNDRSLGLISMRTRIESLGGSFSRMNNSIARENVQQITIPHK